MQDNATLPKGLVAEIEQAKANWLQAWQNFNNADKDFIDVAIWNLRAAVERYDALIKLAKGSLRG
jgi:hypothetical protein